MTSTTWNGTHLEQLDLLAAISRHCACQVGFDGVCVAVCPPHRMLVEDQRALDGLLFARRLARCLESEERRTPRGVALAPTRARTRLGAAKHERPSRRERDAVPLDLSRAAAERAAP